MANASLYRIAQQAKDFMRRICPYDTGKMHDSIRVEPKSKNEYRIVIGRPPATYAVYTNEEWIAPRWRGRHNPNEKWIDQGVAQFVTDLTAQLRGDLSAKGEQERWENQAYRNRVGKNLGAWGVVHRAQGG